MATIDINYNNIANNILHFGKNYTNKRREVTRKQIPSATIRHDFENGFPAITSKKLFYDKVVSELIWFLRGDNNIKYLNENDNKIWNKDAYNFYCKSTDTPMSYREFIKFGYGSVGSNYSVQWRNFGGKVDQISRLIKGMKKDIMGSRLLVVAWNPLDLNKTALPPCHTMFQIIGVPLDNGKFGFELHWHQRSSDYFLGIPFNIASYATLALILEQITGYKALAIQGDIKCVHLYENSIEETKQLLAKDYTKHTNCELEILANGDNFNNYNVSDFILNGYSSEEKLNVEMLAPKKI